jgi:transcription antitermination factor NusG
VTGRSCKLAFIDSEFYEQHKARWCQEFSMPDEKDGSEVHSEAPLSWYALHTRSRHEKRVAERLSSQQLETFLPVHRSRHTWKNGVHAMVDIPLFPCYLFARTSIHERTRLLQHPGVLGFASSSARPTVIPDEEISVLRVATESLRAEPHPYLNSGDAVRIIAGPWRASLRGANRNIE